MSSKKFLWFVWYFLITLHGKAQDFRFNFHQFNAFGVNPAMAVMQKKLSLGYHSRNQRVDAGLSHRTQMLNFLYPFLRNENEPYGTIGLSLYRDRQNYFGEVYAFDILAATSIQIHEPKNIYLAFGLQGGSRSIQDELKGTDYFPAWGAGVMFYQDLQPNSYQKRWFAGVAGSNFLGNERYLENYHFFGQLRWIFSGGVLAWTNGKYSLVPNFRTILHNKINFTNYGLSLRKNFSENTGTLLRYGSWGITAWYAHEQALSFAIDIDTPSITMGFNYSFASQNHLFKYQNANEFVITLKKSLFKKKSLDDRPIINEGEKPL